MGFNSAFKGLIRSSLLSSLKLSSEDCTCVHDEAHSFDILVGFPTVWHVWLMPRLRLSGAVLPLQLHAWQPCILPWRGTVFTHWNCNMNFCLVRRLLIGSRTTSTLSATWHLRISTRVPLDFPGSTKVINVVRSVRVPKVWRWSSAVCSWFGFCPGRRQQFLWWAYGIPIRSVTSASGCFSHRLAQWNGHTIVQ